MDALFTKMVKAGKMVYFLDVKEAKNNSKYVNITSSSPSKEDPKKYAKKSIPLFSSVADEFVEALKEAVEHIKE
jgi:hypothetical protein